MIKREKNPGAVRQIFETFGDNLVSIVLFGSRARKNYSNFSDTDIIVVVNKYKDINLGKMRIKFLLDYGKSLDLHVFSKEDVIKNFENRSPLFVTLLLGKKLLFDRDMFFRNEFEKFVKGMVNEKIKYCEGGKIWEMEKVARSIEISL